MWIIVTFVNNFIIQNKQNIVSFNISEAGLEERGSFPSFLMDAERN